MGLHVMRRWSLASSWAPERGRFGGFQKVVGGAEPDRGGMGAQRLAVCHPARSSRPPVLLAGKVGCIETYLSGPGLAGDHQQEAGIDMQAWKSMKRRSKGTQTRKTLDRHVQRVANSLAALINVLDPDAIVLGGGLSQMPHLYREVPKYWGEYVYSDTVRTRLLPNRHGPSSGVRGAAWLWK